MPPTTALFGRPETTEGRDRPGGPSERKPTDRTAVRRRVLAATAVVVALLAAADAVQSPTVVARRITAALPPGSAQRIPMAHPVQLQQARRSSIRYLDAIGNGERLRELQVVEAASQTTLERARQEAAAALSGRPQPWLTAGALTGYVMPSPGGFARPARGMFTSGFGSRWGAFHAGIDIAGPIGTPIYAFAAGVVVDAGPAQGFGLWVRIQHSDGSISVYGHLYDFFVSKGERVPAGMQIGRMGNRGDSTGPHLHFEIHPAGGGAVDPLPWLAARGIQVG